MLWAAEPPSSPQSSHLLHIPLVGNPRRSLGSKDFEQLSKHCYRLLCGTSQTSSECSRPGQVPSPCSRAAPDTVIPPNNCRFYDNGKQFRGNHALNLELFSRPYAVEYSLGRQRAHTHRGDLDQWDGSVSKRTCWTSLGSWLGATEPTVERNGRLWKVVIWPPHTCHGTHVQPTLTHTPWHTCTNTTQAQLVLRGLCALHLLCLLLLLLSGAHFSGLTEIVPLIHKYVSYSLFRKGGVLSFLEAGRKNWAF